MNKYFILISLIVIFFSNIVFAGSCWYVGGLSYNPSIGWTNSSPQPITINEVTYQRIIFSNSVLTINGFGSYNRLCDNGVSDSSLNYAILDVTNDGTFQISNTSINNTPTTPTHSNSSHTINYSKRFTNAAGNGPAASLGLNYCSSDRGFNVTPSSGNLSDSTPTGVMIGMGTRNEIVFQAINEFGPDISKQRQHVGGYDFDLKIMSQPHAGEYGKKPISISKVSQKVFFAPPPSVFILPLGDDNIEFYEKDGYYEKEVFFTVKAQTYLDLKVKDFELVCEGEGITCTIDSQQGLEYTMSRTNDILIVSGTIRIPKNNIPKILTYKLNLKYDIKSLVALGGEYKDINISSAVSRIDVGYLDKQDFQIQIIGAPDDSSCEGYNGIIGNTGEVIAPRINIKTNFENGLNKNLCSPDNDNWVYCSQREFSIILSNKIAEIFNLYLQAQIINDESEKQKIYQRINNKKVFEIYTRNMDLSDFNLILPREQNLFSRDPLTILEGDNQLANIQRARNLLNNSTFYRESGLVINPIFSVGKYQVEILLGDEGTTIFNENSLSQNTNFQISTNILFDRQNELIDPEKLNIRINFREAGGKPLLNWFFYEAGVESLDDQINQANNSFYNTQIQNRGQVLRFEQDLQNFDLQGILAYPQFAIPLFVKVQKNEDETINSFKIKNISPLDQIDNTNLLGNSTFSYWSGFASSLGEGCEEILEGESSLVYRLNDKIEKIDNLSQIFQVNLYPNQESNLKEGKEFLQTIIYSPILGSAGTQLQFDLNYEKNNLFNKDGICSSTNDCRIKIDNSTNVINWTNSLQNILDGIKNQTICVTAQQDGTSNKVDWILFWNENKIFENLKNAKTRAINADSEIKYCEGLAR